MKNLQFRLPRSALTHTPQRNPAGQVNAATPTISRSKREVFGGQRDPVNGCFFCLPISSPDWMGPLPANCVILLRGASCAEIRSDPHDYAAF